jgi:hypothetical protein
MGNIRTKKHNQLSFPLQKTREGKPQRITLYSPMNIFISFSTGKFQDPVAVWSEVQALIACTMDRGFESHSRHGCLSSSFYVVLSCVGRGLATS